MAFTAPYYTVGKQRAQWHKNKAEAHLAKAGGWGVAGGLALAYPEEIGQSITGTKPYGSSYPLKGPVQLAGAAGIAAGAGHAGLAAYHANRASHIKRDLKNRYKTTNTFDSARRSQGNIS